MTTNTIKAQTPEEGKLSFVPCQIARSLSDNENYVILERHLFYEVVSNIYERSDDNEDYAPLSLQEQKEFFERQDVRSLMEKVIKDFLADLRKDKEWQVCMEDDWIREYIYAPGSLGDIYNSLPHRPVNVNYPRLSISEYKPIFGDICKTPEKADSATSSAVTKSVTKALVFQADSPKNPTPIKLEELLYKMEHRVAADGTMFYCMSDSREGTNYYSVPPPNDGDSPYEAIYQHLCLHWDIDEYTLDDIDHLTHEGACITFGSENEELTLSTEDGAREFLDFLRSKLFDE